MRCNGAIDVLLALITALGAGNLGLSFLDYAGGQKK